MKLQSNVLRHCIWAVKRTANLSKQQHFEDFFPPFFYFLIIFHFKSRTSEQKKMVQKKDASMVAEGSIILKFNVFEVVLDSMSFCQ